VGEAAGAYRPCMEDRMRLGFRHRKPEVQKKDPCPCDRGLSLTRAFLLEGDIVLAVSPAGEFVTSAG